MTLKPRSAGEHFICVQAGTVDSDDARVPGSERTGLVEGNQAGPRQGFEGGGIAHQAAMPRQQTNAERTRHRRGKAHRTGTGYHQHGEAGQQRLVERQIV